MHDPFSNSVTSITGPAETFLPVQPDDANDLPQATRALYVGNGGDIVVRGVRDEEDVTFRNVATGTILDLRLRAIRATGTTATDLVGLA